MTSDSRRAPRSDAIDNRAALLQAASRVLVSRGPGVPLEVVATEAGVGIGTLYRNFPDREALFDAISVRSYQLIEGFASQALESMNDQLPALEAIGLFLDQILEHREDLALPLFGIPALHRASVAQTGERISALMDAVLARGVSDGTVRADAVASDLIIAGAMLAHQLLLDDAWELAAPRIRNLLLDGLRVSTDQLQLAHRSPAPTSTPHFSGKLQSSELSDVINSRARRRTRGNRSR